MGSLVSSKGSCNYSCGLWDSRLSSVLRNMAASIINLFSWPITQRLGCSETITYKNHSWRTQFCYSLWTPWWAALISFKVGRIPFLHADAPFHYLNRKAILLCTQWFMESWVNSPLQLKPLPPLWWLRHLFMVLRRLGHLNDSRLYCLSNAPSLAWTCRWPCVLTRKRILLDPFSTWELQWLQSCQVKQQAGR